MLGLGNSLTVHPHGWSPSEIPSLLHWYRFDTGITKDGDDDITEWADQKGSNNATADGVDTNSPLYSSGAVVFNHTNDVLTFGAPLALGAFSIYIRTESTDVAGDIYMENDGDAANYFFQAASSTRMKIKVGGGNRHDYVMSDPGDDTKFNIGVERKADGDISMYLNNSSLTLDVGDGNTAIGTTLDLTTMGQPLVTVKFYEVIICSDSLDASDRSNLNTYLNLI